MSQHFLVNAKAYVSLICTEATAALAFLTPHTHTYLILSAVAGLGTAFLTWRIPNLTVSNSPSTPGQ
jgi:hypothetical protein